MKKRFSAALLAATVLATAAFGAPTPIAKVV